MHYKHFRTGDYMQVTVVIPNYNGLRFLKTCLDSLENQTSDEFEVLVVDNGSADDSVAYIERNYPWVKILPLEENTGFCGGVNAGIQTATTPYVLLLNNDVEAAPDFVEQMCKAIQKSDKVFSVSSKMVQFYDRSKIDDAGDLYCMLGWAFQRGVGHKVNESQYQKHSRVFSACGGASIYRRSVFEKIGYFDEIHFAYLEDIDVGYRARIAGYENIYCPKAVVYHIGSGTTGSKYNHFKVKLSARNSFYLNYKNMPVGQLLLNAIPLAIGYGIKWAFFHKIGFGKAYLEGLREGICTRKQCRKVPFQKKNLGNYIQIELDMIVNTFVYTSEFIHRKCSHFWN